jgi:Kef-type K+ transport system membrane component KefB
MANLAAYALMIGVSVALFLLIRSAGSTLVAPSVRDAGAITATPAKANVLFDVLFALVVVIVAARLCGALCKRIHQPPVIGEVIAGILLGPSLLGQISPAAMRFVLPPTVTPFLSILAQIGVILFMFLVGLELDTGKLKNRTHATVAISHASILVPFVLGSALALWLYPTLSTSNVPFTIFALFVGVSLSVTAFPVLARILTDRGIHTTRMGTIALACAAVDDVTAWCLLAFIVALIKARVADVTVTFGLTGLYIVFMLVVVRPVIARAVSAQEIRKFTSQSAIAAVLVALLLSTLATEAVGIHAIFGAFLLGAIIPSDSLLARNLHEKLNDIAVILLLPAFFALTGMRTHIGLVQGPLQWLLCGVILVTACIGKFGGTFVAARITGLERHDAAALGVLMNTRGLMELIVLNLGLDLQILSSTLFAMLVMMAVITTLATAPALQLITRGASRQSNLEARLS